LEVKNVEELSLKLKEVWIGNNKLRVNLSFFGRDGRQVSTKPVKTSEEVKRRPLEGLKSGVPKERSVHPNKSFRMAVEGDTSKKVPSSKGKEVSEVVVEDSQLSTPMLFEPNAEALRVFKGSFVGRLTPGSKLKTVQLNLCLEGLRGIRVASLGDGRVVVFSDSGEQVNAAIEKSTWWEGLLHDFHPWYPSVVSTKREVWVKIFGVPLQLWEEQVFSTITNPWGSFLGMDDDTKGYVRFDRARVKLLSPVLGSIDFTQRIMVHGLCFTFRCMEESGGPLEFVHIQKEEDQLQWSAAASSCDSDGFKPAAAEVAGEVFEDSDSDGSVQGQHRSGEEQGGLNPLENNRNFEVISQDPLVNTVEGLPCFSIVGADIGGVGKGQVGASDEIQVVRGMSTSYSEVQGCVQIGGIVDLDGFGEKELELPGVSNGPVLPHPHPSSIIGDPLVDPLEPVWADSSVDPVVGQAHGEDCVDLGPTGLVIVKLDGLISEARDKGVEIVNHVSQGEFSDLSTSASSSQSTSNSHSTEKEIEVTNLQNSLPAPHLICQVVLNVFVLLRLLIKPG
jgi:hypothetical protein